MPFPGADVDPDGLLEFSVVFTERSLNHMSRQFRQVMQDINDILRTVYSAECVAVVPGGGTFAMEAVARQFATNARVLVLRNGLFSYRWSQVFDAGSIPAHETVLKAHRVHGAADSPYVPYAIDQAVAQIRAEQPDVVFLPHVETASGIIVPDSYIRTLADAVHEHGGLLVLDCVASGCVWVDMAKTCVDVLVSAPQKGWSASPAAGLVMMSKDAAAKCRASKSTSFAADLDKWRSIMDAYLQGGHAYHATMPTDALRTLRDAMLEARSFGFEQLCKEQWRLGKAVRELLSNSGFQSVAAEGFEAPGVVVCFTDDPDMQNGKKFADYGLQIAAGVPLMLDEGPDFRSFRIGLFGLDKLKNLPATIERLSAALDRLFSR